MPVFQLSFLVRSLGLWDSKGLNFNTKNQPAKIILARLAVLLTIVSGVVILLKLPPRPA